jgi:steroid delta-isomerase-like uncharacterized protein
MRLANACRPLYSVPPPAEREFSIGNLERLYQRHERSQRMAEQDNLRIVRESWDAWNAHDVEGALKNIDEKHIWETDTLPAPVVGRDGYRLAMQMYIAAFPDLHFRIDQLFASGDRVVTQYTATGTQHGNLMGIPPTQRRAEVHGCTVAEVRNAKVARSSVYWDTGHLLRQLGVMPS